MNNKLPEFPKFERSPVNPRNEAKTRKFGNQIGSVFAAMIQAEYTPI